MQYVEVFRKTQHDAYIKVKNAQYVLRYGWIGG